MREKREGWLQEGLYALRRDNAHSTSGFHTLVPGRLQERMKGLSVNSKIQMKG